MHDSHPNSKSGMPIILGDKGGVLDYCTGTSLMPKQLKLDRKTSAKKTSPCVTIIYCPKKFVLQFERNH
jgi:hypothetical protein